MKNWIFSLMLIIAVFASVAALPAVASDVGDTAAVSVTSTVTSPSATFEQATNLSGKLAIVTSNYYNLTAVPTVATGRIEQGESAYSPPYSRCFTGLSPQNYARSGLTDTHNIVAQVARSGS